MRAAAKLLRRIERLRKPVHTGANFGFRRNMLQRFSRFEANLIACAEPIYAFPSYSGSHHCGSSEPRCGIRETSAEVVSTCVMAASIKAFEALRAFFERASLYHPICRMTSSRRLIARFTRCLRSRSAGISCGRGECQMWRAQPRPHGNFNTLLTENI